MKPDGTDQKVLVGDTQVFDYDWSPDGKMIVYARMDGSFASELYIVPTDGSTPPKNVTRYATYNGDVTWSRTGNKIGFISQRRGMYAPHVLSACRSRGTPARGRARSTGTTSTCAPTASPASRPMPRRSRPNGTQVAFRHVGQRRRPLGRQHATAAAHARHHRQPGAAKHPLVEEEHRPDLLPGRQRRAPLDPRGGPIGLPIGGCSQRADAGSPSRRR